MISSREPIWVKESVLRRFHWEQIQEHGGIQGIRDEGLLASALSRPLQLLSYGDPPPDFYALAAAYAFGLAKNHPFLDGNKRVAAITCELFLNLNGIKFTVGEIEKYPKYLSLASDELTEENFASWLREVCCEIS